jgi:hypothetical protein
MQQQELKSIVEKISAAIQASKNEVGRPGDPYLVPRWSELIGDVVNPPS